MWSTDRWRQQGPQDQLPERMEGTSWHLADDQVVRQLAGDLNNMRHLRAGLERGAFQESREANGAQGQQWTDQQQQYLTRQERRQLELANSDRATIHQPPIRLLFPVDLEYEALGTSHGTGRQTDDSVRQSDLTAALPLVPTRDSFEGSSEHHLSRELRRISLEASRGSGGLYKRLSDIAGRSKSRRVSGGGSGSGRSSLEGGRVDADDNMGGYYPFTRSQAPTSASSPSSTTAQPATGPITPSNLPSTPVNNNSRLGSSSTATQESGQGQSQLEQESRERSDRRRSGSFIPLDMTQPSRKTTAAKTSQTPTQLVERTLQLSVPSARSSTAHLYATEVRARPKGPVTIDHTLTLSDL